MMTVEFIILTIVFGVVTNFLTKYLDIILQWFNRDWATRSMRRHATRTNKEFGIAVRIVRNPAEVTLILGSDFISALVISIIAIFLLVLLVLMNSHQISQLLLRSDTVASIALFIGYVMLVFIGGPVAVFSVMISLNRFERLTRILSMSSELETQLEKHRDILTAENIEAGTNAVAIHQLRS